MQLIERLGGKPQFPIQVIDRIVDIPALLLQQPEQEKAAQSLFQQARNVAEQNQVRGVLAKMKATLALSPSDVKGRSSTIHILERMASDEEAHIKVVQGIISALNIHMQK